MVPAATANTQALVSVRAFLRDKCGFSQGLWRRLKWNGELLINGEPVKAATAQATAGDIITCRIPEESGLAVTPMKLDIRYEDEYMLVVNKPKGILVHPTGGDHANTLGNGILHYYQMTGQNIGFHPVHRLDRNTTGLVLVAKLPQLQNMLTQKNMGKFFHRSYIAMIEGTMPEPDGIIDLPIARHPDSIIQRICTEDGKPALTRYRTLAVHHNKSLLYLELATGRTHQIRVHLAALGHPLPGDDLYGGSMKLIDRQALHAVHLDVDNPLTGQNISIWADVPQDIIKAFYQCM